jgi:hypothetical protein
MYAFEITVQYSRMWVGGDSENAEIEPRHGNGNIRNIPRIGFTRVLRPP